MKNFHFSFTCTLLLLFCFFGYAQNPGLRFTQLTTDHGLSQSNITSILQDDKGFLWFGTFNGLNKFDGYDFEVFNYIDNDPRSISHNYISALFQGENGNLWVGTSDGLNSYDYKTNSFTTYKHQPDNPQSLADNQIEAILADSRGRLWVGTRSNGLDLFDAQSGTFRHHLHNEADEHSLSSNRIVELFEDGRGNIWIAHQGGSIDILSADVDTAGKFRVHREKISDFPITAIVETADAHVWIATQGDGLYRVKFIAESLRKIAHYSRNPFRSGGISSNIILSLMLENNNKLWIGTEDDGINILDISRNEFSFVRNDPLDQSSLNHNSVWKIYQDRAGNIWIGTYAYGINLLSGNKSFIYHYHSNAGDKRSLSHNMVNAFSEDEDGNIWIATDGGGLNFFDRRNNTFTHYNSQNTNIDTDVIVSLYEDSRGRLWVGTWTNGLYLFNRERKRFTHYTMEKHGLGSNRILHILEDKDGGLWLSTFYGGVTYFKPEDGTVAVYNSENSGLSDNYTRVVYQDLQGHLWIGTDSGLDFFDPRRNVFINYTHEISDTNSISKGFVHSIFQTADATIWLGTSGGLNKFDREKNRFIHYNKANGLPDNEVKCIIEDNDGNFWLSTNKGISAFDRTSGVFKNYDVSDGLQGNEFNARSGWKTKAGEIVFGGNNGFDIFQPTALRNNDVVPPVLLTGFKVFNKSVAIGADDGLLAKHINETEKITLAYWQTVFSINFVALNYVSPEKNQYAYMLEGFDSDWNYVGEERNASYTNLDAGDYVFRVKASNNDGVWNETGRAIAITINPPFWRTWWAYLLMAILIITAAAFIINHFVGRQQLRSALKMEHLELEKMYELDRMKTRFFSNISHEFHSPLTLILGPLEKLISSQEKNGKLQDSLRLIQRSAKRLQRMTNQLQHFQQMENGDLQLRLGRGNIIHFIKDIALSFQDYAIDRKIDYKLAVLEESFTAWFDADKLDKIIYNLLSNAFKFTPDGGSVAVNVAIIDGGENATNGKSEEAARQYVEIIVSDSGIGIPADNIEHIFERHYRANHNNGEDYQGSGVGLAFVYELVTLYQGKINVESSEGEGTRFTVHIPVDEHFLEERQLVEEFSAFEGEPIDNGDLIDAENNNGEARTASADNDMPVVLIVEDDVEIRSFMKESFQFKYRIFSAKNGKDGIKRATKLVPDLVISDVKMPEVSGIELCNQLKEDEKTSHIPIILLTAYNSHDIKIEGLRKGADAYLPKPFSIDELDIQITNLLKTRRQLKEKYGRQIMLEPTRVEIEDVDEKFLQRIIQTIESRIDDKDLNAESLSKEIGMSRMQLYRKLRGLTNLTVHEFIRTIRLKRAAQLLHEKRMTITEVAYEVGFNDLTYFARCFRKHYQKSPSEFMATKN